MMLVEQAEVAVEVLVALGEMDDVVACSIEHAERHGEADRVLGEVPELQDGLQNGRIVHRRGGR